MSSSSAGSVAGIRARPAPPPGRNRGFTLLELVVAITLFAFIVVTVLADREKSLEMSRQARIIQTVRYLAAIKLDEVRHDPAKFGDRDSGGFEDFETDWQTYEDYSWDLEIEQVVAAGSGDDAEGEYLFGDDEDEPQPTSPDGTPLDPHYVRRLTMTVRFEPEGSVQAKLSIQIVTYLPPDPEEEES